MSAIRAATGDWLLATGQSPHPALARNAGEGWGGGAARVVVIAVACALSLFNSLARADSLGDPMRPPSAQSAPTAGRAAAPKSSRVTAIFVSNQRRVAVFDGRVVRAGDRVGDVVILDVLADGVRFAQSGRTETARLPKTSVAVRRERADDSKAVATVSQESEP